MAVGEKSEDPQNISAGPSERRPENENGPASSIATGVGTSINTSCEFFHIKMHASLKILILTLVSFSGSGDFAENSRVESETSDKTADKNNESVNAKLVNASNESTATSANTSTKAKDDESNETNETSQENFSF